MKGIPVAAARRLGEEYGLTHVIVLAYDQHGDVEHVVTWGHTRAACAAAAIQGDEVKDFLGWPPEAIKR